MFKRVMLLGLALVMLLSSVAMAEITNRDLQLGGGLAAVNANDTFFFCAMEDGVTKHWGLYKTSSMADGPILEITDAYPANFICADNSDVFYLMYTSDKRDEYALYKVGVDGGEPKLLQDDISAAFADENDSFFFVKKSDLYTLWKYDCSDEKATKIKDMSGSKKTIYDACSYKGSLYFLAKDASNVEYGYEYHASSGKATNLDKPSPQLVTGLLYEGYRLYANDNARTRIFAVSIGRKSAEQIGKKYGVSLSNPRFGDALYAYDSDNNAIVRCPLDGSGEKSIKLDGDLIARMILGGNPDELLLCYAGKVYSMPANLSSMTPVIDFPMTTAGQVWSYVLPGRGNTILIMGYSPDTISYEGSLPPSAVYVIDRATNERLFGFPVIDEGAAPAPDTTTPDADTGETVEEGGEEEEEETYYSF